MYQNQEQEQEHSIFDYSPNKKCLSQRESSVMARAVQDFCKRKHIERLTNEGISDVMAVLSNKYQIDEFNDVDVETVKLKMKGRW